MKYKKTIIISLAPVIFYFTMLALASSPIGYGLALLLPHSVYSFHSTYKRCKLENEGEVPGEFQIAIEEEYKRIELIPILLDYRSRYPKRINITYRISEERVTDYQYLDFTRMELVLRNGKRESLRPSVPLFRLYLTDRDPRNSYLYEEGKLQDTFELRGCPRQAEFRLSGRHPAKRVTLVAEGTLRRDVGEDQPFRQIATWQLVKGWGAW